MLQTAAKSQHPNVVAVKLKSDLSKNLSSLEQTKRILTQDLKGISQLALKTPKKQVDAGHSNAIGPKPNGLSQGSQSRQGISI